MPLLRRVVVKIDSVVENVETVSEQNLAAQKESVRIS